MKTFGLVNLMPLLKFERVWWNIQSAESSPFLIFPVSETRAAVVSRNAKARTYQLRLIQSPTASFCPYCQVWAFLAMRTPGLNPTSLGARSTCHGKVSCLYLTASPLG